MKVKVNYTVDMNDVPALVQEILASIRRDVTDYASRLIFNPNNFDKMVADCQAFREKLDTVDNQIEDMINITAGWLQATHPEPEKEKEEEGEKEFTDEEQEEGAVDEEQV